MKPALTHRALDSSAAVERELQERGFATLRGVVPLETVDAALRHLHLDLVRRGLPAEELGSWLWSAHWFPHLNWDTPIVALAERLPAYLREGEACDPQIVMQPPDDCDDAPLVSHVDTEPEWANGRRYRRIVGVALTAAYGENGGLVVWPFDREETEALDLAAGDVVVMHPDLPHASGYNREGAFRTAVYFRFLTPA